MSFDPTSTISLIQNCKALYDYSADVRHSTAERRRLLDEVRSLEPELQALQRLAYTPGVAGEKASMDRLGKLLDPAQPFVKVVDETLDRIKDVLTYGTSDPKATRFKVLGRRGAAALWWTIDKAEVKDLLLDLERYKSRIGLAIQHDMFNHIITEYRLKVAKFISANDFTGHQSSLIKQKLKDTGTWLIEDRKFVAWRDSIDSPRTLWCYGHPGAGKSVMAASIVDHLQFEGAVVLSVFCRYSLDTFTTPHPVLCGLLRQLIENSPKFPPAMDFLYRSQTRPNPDMVSILLAEIAASHARPIYLVIDALDECRIALDLLHVIQQLGSSFRVLITSRPVFNEIEKYPSIKIRASDHDILLAVDASLPKLNGAWLDDALKSTIRAKIVEKADGMFLLASLQLRELERDVTRRRDVIDILDSLPRTLDDAYNLTFQRIREQGERKNELVCRVLAVVSLQSIHLHIGHVQHLLAAGDVTQYTDIETILQCCRGLIRRTTDDYDIEFIHYSVHEYTIANWSELFPDNSNRSDVCLELGYFVLTSPDHESMMKKEVWDSIVFRMREPKALTQVIRLLSTPTAQASLVIAKPELAPFVHDPLLIACQRLYWYVMEYMILTVPPDVQRFNEALRVSQSVGWYADDCIERINSRPDMRVNSHGQVVAVDLDGGEGNSR
ncbi:hypothetical protein CPB85DRAFT_406069 [Mucidula mucida]|nr:hypothetical protein CPB85DRAFT_406069 [Mucidula mucida]